jgi:uncharacterized protein
VDFEWDEAKRRTNLLKHGVDFAEVELLDWLSILQIQDTRRPYGEVRWQALGRVGQRLYMLIYTKRGERVRVISMRTASKREHAVYEATTTNSAN